MQPSAWPTCATRRPTRSRSASTSSSSPTARPAPTARRSRRCWPSRRAPPPRARGHAPARRPRARVRRAARGPPLRDADRLRRQRDQPVPDVRDRRRAGARRARRRRRRPTRPQLQDRQGDRQGPAQDDLQDGDLDDPVLLRRADLRGGRPRARRSSTATSPAPRRGSAASGSTCWPRETLDRHAPRLPARASTTCCRSAASTRGAATASTTCGTRRRSRCSSTRSGRRRRSRSTARAARPRSAPRRRPSTTSTPRRSTARRVNRATLRGLLTFRHRGREPDRRSTRSSRATEIVKRFATGAMSLGLDLDRGPRDAGDRDEPPRRALEHRRGRGGPARFTPDANGDRRRSAIKQVASGRFGVTIHYLRQRRPAPDQDGPGRQARRGRPAARPQGRRVHRLGAPHDARRRPDLAAAAPRHLLDRGPQAAHLRPALREPDRRGLGQARRRGRRRHRRRGRRQGQRRPRADLRPRRRHRRLAAELDQSRPACRGRSAWPRPSRRCCSTTCARGSRSRPTAS